MSGLLCRTLKSAVPAGVFAALCGPALAADSTPAPPEPLVILTPISGTLITNGRDPDNRFNGAYTRLIIGSRGPRTIALPSDPCENREGAASDAQNRLLDQANLLPYEERNWIARALGGKTYTVNYTANVDVGNFSATVPLVTLEHTSDATNGERFTRFVGHSLQKFPLFLVKSDGADNIVRLRYQVRVSSDYTGSTVAAAVKATTTLVSALSPDAGVLTTLTAQRTKDAAAGLDTALASLLKRSVGEDQVFENDVRRWGKELNLKLYLPKSESNAPKRKEDRVPLGVWAVKFESPRPSIFSNVQICPVGLVKDCPDPNARPWCEASFRDAAVHAERDAIQHPAQVLQFNLLQKDQQIGTVIGYLRQRDWWAGAQKALADGQGRAETLRTAVGSLCRSIKQEIAHLDLNDVDAGIIARAVGAGENLPAGAAEMFPKSAECAFAYAVPADTQLESER